MPEAKATQRVWMIYVCTRHGEIECDTCTRARGRHGPLFDEVEVLPTSLLEELAETFEERAAQAHEAEARYPEGDPIRHMWRSQGNTWQNAAAKLRSLLSQEEPDGEQ